MNFETKSKWIYLTITAAFALFGTLMLAIPMKVAFAAQDGTGEGADFSADEVTATTTVNLNIRSGPGLEYEILDTLPVGSVVGFTGCTDGTGDWVQVNAADGSLGWVAARYLSNVPEVLQIKPADVPQEEATPTLMEEESAVFSSLAIVTGITLDNLNVRSGPGLEYEVLDILPAGSVAGFTGSTNATGEWFQIEPAYYDFQGGWVNARYIDSFTFPEEFDLYKFGINIKFCCCRECVGCVIVGSDQPCP